MFIIIPAVIGIGALGALGIGGAVAAAREKRQEEERKREEASREQEDHDSQMRAAEHFIAKHDLAIKRERLVELANSVSDVIRAMRTESRWTSELQQKEKGIRKLGVCRI